MIVTPNFHFKGQCWPAIQFYQKAFRARVIRMIRYKDADPEDFTCDPEYGEWVYHAELLLGDKRVMMADMTEGTEPSGDSRLSLVLTFDCADNVKDAYEVLKEGAEIIQPMCKTTYSSCFVSLVDRYGVRWELMTEQAEY